MFSNILIGNADSYLEVQTPGEFEIEIVDLNLCLKNNIAGSFSGRAWQGLLHGWRSEIQELDSQSSTPPPHPPQFQLTKGVIYDSPTIDNSVGRCLHVLVEPLKIALDMRPQQLLHAVVGELRLQLGNRTSGSPNRRASAVPTPVFDRAPSSRMQSKGTT